MPLTIERSDREAAANAIKAYRGDKNDDWQGRVRSGKCDDGEMVQAFAAHRLLGQQEGLRRAAKIARKVGAKDAARTGSPRPVAERIAAAIEAELTKEPTR